VYALGVILFEALTGERPFDAETYNELILKIATEPLPSIAALNPDLDARLIEIVERAMARDPKDRFPDVKTLALALEPFAGGVRFRSMQTLNPHEKNSGDFPIGALEPTRPGPIAEAVASSAPPVSYDVVAAQPQRGTRMAIGATFASLLACAAVAVYFLNHPELPALQPQDPGAEAPAAVSSSAPPPPEVKAPVAPSIPVPTIELPLPTPTPAPSAAPSGEASAPVELAVPGPRGISPSKSSSTPSKRSTRAAKPSPEAPAEPTPAAPAPVVVRALPNDWDRRLDQPAAPATNVHMPAGHINMNDFR
jgi:serine/threonine-protein kinase